MRHLNLFKFLLLVCCMGLSLSYAQPINTSGSSNASFVGIGTASPAAKLHVFHRGTVGSLGNDPALAIEAVDNLAPSGYNLYVQGHEGGSVPHVQLTSGQSDSRLTLKCASSTDKAPRLQMTGPTDFNNPGWAIFDYGSREVLLPNASFKMRWQPGNATDPSIDMIHAAGSTGVYLAPNVGNVGVGTNAPQELFHVAGTVRSDDLVGSGTRNVMADANGNLVIGSAVGGSDFQCSDLNNCSVGDLGNVDIASAVSGDYLFFNGTSWTSGSGPGGGSTFSCADLNSCDINELLNVSAASASSGDVLTYNGSAWIAATPSGGGGGADTDWNEVGDSLQAKTGNFIQVGGSSIGGIARVWVDARSTSDAAAPAGVYGITDSDGWGGVVGRNFSAPANFGDTLFYSGVYGESATTGGNGEAINEGVSGYGVDGYLNRGVFGFADGAGSTEDVGVYGYAGQTGVTGIGVLGRCDDIIADWAGYFIGDIGTTGTVYEFSDARLKRDVENLPSGLEVVMNLRPVSYFYRDDTGIPLNSESLQYGFIAQEVEQVLPSITKDVNMPNAAVNVRKNGETSLEKGIEANESYKSLDYNGVIPFLTKSIQEQQAMLEAQNEMLEIQRSEIEGLKAQVRELAGDEVSPADRAGSQLFQSVPNPNDGYAIIPFYLDREAQAVIEIRNTETGALVKTLNVEGQGFQQINVDMTELSAGVYTYSLKVGEQDVETRKMVVVR